MTKNTKDKILFKHWTKRRWLNNVSDGGAAFIKMSVEPVNDNKSWEEAAGTIEIADCSRIICLEFKPGSKEQELNNAMKKLDILMLSVGEFRGKLQNAIDAARLSRAHAAKQEK